MAAPARLHARELARYDEAILRSPARVEQTQAFLAWAAGYDDNTCGGSRTLAHHTAWLSQFTYPVLELRGELTVAERAVAMQHKLAELRLKQAPHCSLFYGPNTSGRSPSPLQTEAAFH